jgi:hypothetical protein
LKNAKEGEMSRVINLEQGWLFRQIDAAQARASQLPAWLTRSNDNPREGTAIRQTPNDSELNCNPNAVQGSPK